MKTCSLLPWTKSLGLAIHHVDHFLPLSQFPYRFQRMDSVPGTSTCSGVEHHLIFYSHSSQWSSSDCLPRQSSHSVVQDTVWNLFSHHPGNRTPLAPVPPPFYPHCPGLNGSCWKDYRIPSFSFYSYCPHVYSTSNTSIFSNIPMCLLAYLSGLNRWKNYKITFHVVW